MTKSYKHSIRCFSGSGHHYPWQLGVALYLQENYDLSDCCFAGAGSFVASILATDLSVKDYITKWVRDGYRTFNAHPFDFYFICHSVISLVGAKWHQMIMNVRMVAYTYL